MQRETAPFSSAKEVRYEALRRGLPEEITWPVQRTYAPRYIDGLGLKPGDSVQMRLCTEVHNDGAPILYYRGHVTDNQSLEAFRTGGYGSTMTEAVTEAKGKLHDFLE